MDFCNSYKPCEGLLVLARVVGGFGFVVGRFCTLVDNLLVLGSGACGSWLWQVFCRPPLAWKRLSFVGHVFVYLNVLSFFPKSSPRRFVSLVVVTWHNGLNLENSSLFTDSRHSLLMAHIYPRLLFYGGAVLPMLWWSAVVLSWAQLSFFACWHPHFWCCFWVGPTGQVQLLVFGDCQCFMAFVIKLLHFICVCFPP